MNHVARLIATASLAATASMGAAAARAVDLYVSPNGMGSRCSQAAPCSLEAAQLAVRTVAARQRDDIHVNLLDGTYSLTQPLALVETPNASDSGHNGHQIIWQAAAKAHPVLSGGVALRGWTPYDTTLNIWRADAPPKLNARQLYVNGRRADRTITSDLMAGFSVTEHGFRLRDPLFNRPIDISNFHNLQDVELVRLFNWQLSRCNVTSATVTDINVHPVCFYNSKAANLGIYIENAFELLNKPGQWYLDRSGAVGGQPSVYYIPRAGEKLEDTRAVLSATEKLLTLAGADMAHPIHDVTIKGLSFSHGTWFVDQSLAGRVGGYQGLQAGVHLLNEADFLKADHSDSPDETPQPPSMVGGFYDPGNLAYEEYLPGVVNVSYARGISFLDNTFSHLGATALAMLPGVQDSRIVGNEFFDISASAIQLGGVEPADHHPCGDVPTCDNGRVTQNNIISNNRISDVSSEYLDAVGIFVGYTRNTVISNNELVNLPYSGISMGWGWGWVDKNAFLRWKNPTIAGGNRVVNNRIDHFLTRQRDGAAIYTLGGQPGSVIAGNFASDGKNDFAGIYQDEGSSGFTVEKNVATRVRNFLLINCNKNDITQGNTYRQNYSDFGSVYNSCFRGKNTIEAPTVFADRNKSDKTWPPEVKAITEKAGLEPEFKARALGKITAVELGAQTQAGK